MPGCEIPGKLSALVQTVSIQPEEAWLAVSVCGAVTVSKKFAISVTAVLTLSSR
jgi:hypothetical protein